MECGINKTPGLQAPAEMPQRFSPLLRQFKSIKTNVRAAPCLPRNKPKFANRSAQRNTHKALIIVRFREEEFAVGVNVESAQKRFRNANIRRAA